MKITYVVGYRDRGEKRLDNFITSLKRQVLSEGDEIEIVVSVFGGSLPHKVIKKFPDVKYVYVETSEIWNRGKALNTGIRSAYADVICCTDVDMIFSESVAHETLAFFKKDINSYVYTNIYMAEETKDVDFDNLHKYITPHNKFTMIGTGGYQCFARKNWFLIGGYRECYQGWGVEDTDLYKRVYQFANPSNIYKLPDNCLVIHIGHQSEIEKARANNDIAFLNAVDRNVQFNDFGMKKGDL
jgi:predicted glycosyltransferase involved in capsule biosynthesis